MPGPNIEPIEVDLSTSRTSKETFVEIADVIHKASSQASQLYQKALEKYQQHQKSDLSDNCKQDSHNIVIIINIVSSRNFEFEATFTMRSRGTWILPYIQNLGYVLICEICITND